MDPDAALTRCRNLVREIEGYSGAEYGASLAEELAEQFTALDEWMTKHGCPPRAWATGEVVP